MIDIEDRPLEWYIEALRKGEYFSFPRLGDGEWFAIIRGGGTVSVGLQKIDAEIQRDMTEALLSHALSPGVIFGMQRYVMRVRRLRSGIERFIAKHKLDISWVLGDVFSDASRYGLLYPLLEQFRKMKVVIIGPQFLSNGQSKLFRYHIFINVPWKNCYSAKARVISDILTVHERWPKDIVYSFSCGPLAETLILELHEKLPGNFLIDFGSLWDVFCGRKSRGYTKDEAYTQKIYYQNLGGTA